LAHGYELKIGTRRAQVDHRFFVIKEPPVQKRLSARPTELGNYKVAVFDDFIRSVAVLAADGLGFA
jgi:hypothetical protein